MQWSHLLRLHIILKEIKAYEEIALLSAGILSQHYPNTKAVAKSLTTTSIQ